MTDRRSLLQSLRASHAAPRDTQPLPAPPPAGAADLTTHPAWRQIALIRAASETMAIPSPFFRRIEAAEGTRIRIAGRWAENFAAYDYLSLNRSPDLARAVTQAVEAWGVSATASRLVGGEHDYHRGLEHDLARFLGTEQALVFVSGHATNHAVLRTLLGPEDLVLVDQLAHNSVFEGIRAAGCAHLTFPHNDVAWVDAKLAELRHRHGRVLIAIEGLYSMDGDMPDLAGFVAVKHRHEALLMLDEAHSIGTLGATGRGLREECGVAAGDVDIVMGTLSKTFCSCGGFIAGSSVLIDILRYHAPGFVYSVGLSAPNAAAAQFALDRLATDPAPVRRLRGLGLCFRKTAEAAGLDCGLGQGTAIAPVIVGDSALAGRLSQAMLEAGVNVLPILAPAVPDRSARLRFFLNAGHSEAAVEEAIAQTARALTRLRGQGR